MIAQIISQRLAAYAPLDAVDQENVLAEILQHYVLAALARNGFFNLAEFHGGTYLRIIHHIERFSEDLDFVLKKSSPAFTWDKFLKRVQTECAYEGIFFEVPQKAEKKTAVRKAVLSATFGDDVSSILKFSRHPRQKIKIKLEADTNPPSGSTFESVYIQFPQLTMMTAQTLSSAFASNCHALLCREYTKGRDWYDFLFYVSLKVHPNFTLLRNALRQRGPWTNSVEIVDADWFAATLGDVIQKTKWKEAARDVARFLSAKERETLRLWNNRLFTYHLDEVREYLKKRPPSA